MNALGPVTLVVDDYDDALAFCTGVLGFRTRADTPLDARKRWVAVEPTAGGTGLLLARAANGAQRERVGDQTGGRVGFFLRTDDFAAEHARLTAAGVPFEEPRREEPYGTVAVFRDPYGNRWDLIQHRDGRAGARGPREVLALYHRAMLDRDADALAGLYAADAVHEFPFTFPGMPARLTGREAVRANHHAAWDDSAARPEEIRDLVVHPSADPEVLVVEQTVAGTIAPEGRPFRFPGVLTLRVRAGELVHVRDAMDGLAVAHGTGRLDAVAAAMRAAGPVDS